MVKVSVNIFLNNLFIFSYKFLTFVLYLFFVCVLYLTIKSHLLIEIIFKIQLCNWTLPETTNHHLISREPVVKDLWRFADLLALSVSM